MPNDRESGPETVAEPAKLLRVAGMAERLLEELHEIGQLRQDGTADATRARVDTAYRDSLWELRGALSTDLSQELERLAAPLRDAEVVPSEVELRLAEAQLSGWLQGLMHGLQAGTSVRETSAQLEQAQQQLQQGLRQEQRGYR